jgi:hypothetical protein
MAVKSRVVILNAAGRLERFPLERWTRLWNGTPELPEHAGKTLRFLDVLVVTRGRTIIAIHDAQGIIVKIDAEGRFDRGQMMTLLRAASERVESSASRAAAGSVLQAGHIFVRRRQEHLQKAHWAPSRAQWEELRVILGLRPHGPA